MQRPFLKLRESLRAPLQFNFENDIFSEKPLKSYEKTWEEIIKNSKPLKEKNFYWKFLPKKAFWNLKKEWPPEKIEIKVWLTSEYIEGKAPGISSRIVNALREGKFPIKRVLNLRGLSVKEAELAFEEFIKESILKEERCILIIHGRGLASRSEPVLKNKVKEWLEKGPFRRYILAFTSARPCDGGLGATYVLLSSKPIKK